MVWFKENVIDNFTIIVEHVVAIGPITQRDPLRTEFIVYMDDGQSYPMVYSTHPNVSENDRNRLIEACK